MLHLVKCRHTKPLWNKCLLFCRDTLDAPDMTRRVERAIIFNQEKEDKMLPEATCAFIRHAFNIFYHDFANVEKAHIFCMAKGILQSPHVLSEGSDAICGENQTTTHSSDIHRPYSGGVGRKQEKVRANNRDRHHWGLGAHVRLQRRDHSSDDQPQDRIRRGQEEPRNSTK